MAVENALKVAFDWKVRKNLMTGKKELGTKVIHFNQAFHGRSGYTLSLTNTNDPRKTMYFPKFNWPRINNPKLSFPLSDLIMEDVLKEEKKAIDNIKSEININYEEDELNLSLKGSITGDEARKFLKDGCESNLKTIDSSSAFLDLDSPILCLTMKDLGYAKEYRVSSSYFTSFLNSSENDLEELNALARMFPNMLKIKWSLEVPGQLIESNGKMLAGSMVEWEWNFKDLVS